MGQMFAELRYATRGLRRNPGFTAVALLVLAVGIGANTAVFSVVYNVLLKPLKYVNPERLVVLLDKGTLPVSPADYLDYRAQATAFEHVEAAQGWGGTIETRDRAEMTEGLQVSAALLSMLGVQPERGRLFRAGEDQPGAAPVVILSHLMWQRQFSGDPNIVGKTIHITGQPYTVIGVMPATFQFAPFWITEAQMWAPLNLANRIQDRAGRSLRVFARLKPGISIERAQTQMTTIAQRLEHLYPNTNTGVGVQVVPLLEKVTGPVRPTLVVLLATVAFVLMIACANVANLLLTRAIGRRREIAVRLAIGAARWHLIRQLATESLLVSILGGIAGTLLAASSLSLLPRLLPPGSLPRLGEVTMQPLVLLFAVGASIVTGLLSGLFPAIESSAVDVSENLKQGSRGSAGGSQPRGRRFLIAAEVSLALILLVCAGLMIRTLSELGAVNPGFNSKRLLTLYVFPPAEDVTSDSRRVLFDRVSDALMTVPGVERVSAINHLPISGDVWTLGYAVPGRPAPAPGQEPSAVYRVVRPGYFATMQIPLLRGREFSDRDNAHAAPVVIVSERLARHQWPGRNPVGETLQARVPSANDGVNTPAERFTIIGVVRNVHQSDWTGEPDEEFYLPYLQRADAWDQTHMAFVVRTGVDARSVFAAVETAVRSVDPHIAISDFMPMEEIISDKLWRSTLSAVLLGSFASIALVLAAVGIYGVISYSVRQRRQEIGIRMALGAESSDVLRLALRESLGPVFAGIAVGVALSLGATRWLASLLYGVEPTDPWTFTIVGTGLLLVACLATVIPAWRAIDANVLTALRDE
ncbi:MAG: ABC transporter permease [Acidobacteriaceae bacterium]|nr:ABC transporter permease [Acidobacteriaceae bacterium]